MCSWAWAQEHLTSSQTLQQRALRLTIFGSSEGLSGSTAILTTACVWNASGRKMCTSPSRNSGTICAQPEQE